MLRKSGKGGVPELRGQLLTCSMRLQMMPLSK